MTTAGHRWSAVEEQRYIIIRIAMLAFMQPNRKNGEPAYKEELIKNKIDRRGGKSGAGQDGKAISRQSVNGVQSLNG